MDLAVPVVRTPAGLRAVTGGRAINPDGVARYLDGKFGAALGPARTAMRSLMRSLTPSALSGRAYPRYVQFRPEVPKGVRGWGRRGGLIWREFERWRGARYTGRWGNRAFDLKGG